MQYDSNWYMRIFLCGYVAPFMNTLMNWTHRWVYNWGLAVVLIVLSMAYTAIGSATTTNSQGASVVTQLSSAPPLTAESSDDALFLRNVWRLRAGEGYYDAMAETLLESNRAGRGILDAASWFSYRLPTLYVWGDRDATVGPSAARFTADFVTGPFRFEVLPGVGHFVTDEAPTSIEHWLFCSVPGWPMVSEPVVKPVPASFSSW